MRATRWAAVALVATLAGTGCQSMRTQRGLAAAEPPLVVQGDGAVVEASPGVTAARPVTVVDRHPLLSKPREYYENSGSNKIVKTAAAGIIGVPAGIVGEVRQIIVGNPQPTVIAPAR